MKFDLISKEIVDNFVAELIKDFLKLNVKNIKTLNIEFKKIESKRADFLALVDDKFLVHIELQTNYQNKFEYRMLRYFSEIKLNYDYPLKQCVIFLGTGKLNNRVKDFDIDYSFDIIDLKEIDCELFLNKDNPYGVILSILCDFKGRDKKEVILQIINKLKHYPKFKDYFLMLEELSSLRNLKDSVKEIEMAILFDEIKIEELPSYEIGLEKGLKKGIEKGIEKGIIALYKLNKDKKEIAKLLDIDEKIVEKVLKKV